MMAKLHRSNSDGDLNSVVPFSGTSKKIAYSKIKNYELIIYHDEENDDHDVFIKNILIPTLRSSHVKSWLLNPDVRKDESVFSVDYTESNTVDQRLYRHEAFGTSKPVYIFLYPSKHFSSVMREKGKETLKRAIAILVRSETYTSYSTTEDIKLPKIKWVGSSDPNFAHTLQEAIASRPWVALFNYVAGTHSLKTAQQRSKGSASGVARKTATTSMERSSCQTPDILKMSQKRMYNEDGVGGDENNALVDGVGAEMGHKRKTNEKSSGFPPQHDEEISSGQNLLPPDARDKPTESNGDRLVRCLLGDIRESIQANGYKLDEIQRTTNQQGESINSVKTEQENTQLTVSALQQQLATMEKCQEVVFREMQNLSPKNQPCESQTEALPKELHDLFKDLANKIGDLWILVAVHLQLPKKIIDDIRTDYEPYGREVQIYFMLEMWMRMKGPDMAALNAAATAVGCQAIMEGRSMPLEELYVLRCSRGQIVEDLLLAPLVCDKLMTDDVLTMPERNQVCVERKRDRQASKLLDLIESKDGDAFYKLISALWNTGQKHLAELLYVGRQHTSLILEASVCDETQMKDCDDSDADLKLPTMCTQSD